MKAIILNSFGSPDVLKLEKIEKPTPGDSQVLIKIHATSVNYGDVIARNFKSITPRKFNMPLLFWLAARFFFGVSAPKIKILGSEYSGEVEATGKQVTRFKKGDLVFGYRGQNMGAYAEYLCVPDKDVLAHKPTNMSHKEAAVIPSGGMTAFAILHKADIQSGQRVLINGASGGIGSIAVQLAKNAGAHVTGVCSGERVDYVKALGADNVIDYTKQDFTSLDESWDIIFDVLGKSSFSKCKRSLIAKGRYIRVSFKMRELLQMLWTSMFGGKKVICALSPQSTQDLESIKELVESGVLKSIIDKSFPLEKTAEAHRYVEEGRRKGNVVITV